MFCFETFCSPDNPNSMFRGEIARAVAIYRKTPDLNDQEVFRTLVNEGTEHRLAARLVEFLPIAYTRLILGASGVRFSDKFQRTLRGGEIKEMSFSLDTVWQSAIDFASGEAKNGVSRRELLLAAARSSEFSAINQLLNGGSELRHIVLTSPRFLWPEPGPSNNPSD